MVRRCFLIILFQEANAGDCVVVRSVAPWKEHGLWGESRAGFHPVLISITHETAPSK